MSKATQKRFSWKTVSEVQTPYQALANRLFLQPIYHAFTYFFVNFTSFTPNMISMLGFIAGILCGIFFLRGEFLIGALFFELSNILDTIDGRIARLKGLSSKFGYYLDTYVGFWVMFFETICFSLGLYFLSGEVAFIVVGFVLYFFTIVHFTEAALVVNILGGSGEYKEAIFGKTKKIGIMQRAQAFLVKYGLREPFNLNDVQHTLFFLAPLLAFLGLNLYLEIMLFLCAGLLLHSLFWFARYAAIIRAVDSKTSARGKK